MIGAESGPLRIVSIVNAFGGSGISGAEHSLALARRGHRVTMITYAVNTLLTFEAGIDRYPGIARHR